MTQASIKKVAFIGTGIMGAPMAGHILDAGYDLTVYNRTKSKADDLVARGAHWADSPAKAAADADVIFTMVGYPTDVEDVYLSHDGVLAAAKKGSYMIDLTTSSPQLARDIHAAAEIDDKHAFDMPVTGGEGGAIAGTLTCICGATEEDVAPLLPLLQTFGKSFFYFGEAGCGQTAKLCNQVSLASCMVGMADAISLAEQGGVDVHKMIDMVSTGMGNSVALSQLGPKAADGDYKPGFLTEHLRKDISLAIQESEEGEFTLPGAENAFVLYDMLCQIGGKRMGSQAIELLYQEQPAAVAAGLDWSLLDTEAFTADDDHECGCGHDHHHDHGHECGCGHDHGHDHECGCGHDHGHKE